MPFEMVANGNSCVPSPVASFPLSLETKTPSSSLVQHAASSDTSPMQAWVPLPPSPPAPLMPLAPLVFIEPPPPDVPPLGAPASVPLPPPDLPALPACDVPAVLPHIAVALQSLAELLQAASWVKAAVKPKPS